jgi:hypothetical protein
LVGVGHFFASDQRSHRLVLLTDGIEDSAVARFDRALKIDVGHLLTSLQEGSAVPNLAGTDIFLAGASARTAVQLREIERFWSAYFNLTGGHLNPAHYGAVLTGWPAAPGRP